jgi:hypothetical protein
MAKQVAATTAPPVWIYDPTLLPTIHQVRTDPRLRGSVFEIIWLEEPMSRLWYGQ